ncbi:cytochrome P450 [Aspergillus karnatakaensis]|uniref:cytochrome P450 n=1 Tax=Aspergillus karnatakaensis TaxID=1810916 RepID=UPI003CCCBE35
MLTTLLTPWTITLSLLTLYLLRRHLRNRQHTTAAARLHCKPPPTYPISTPNPLGLAVLYEFYKADQVSEVEEVTRRQLNQLSSKHGRDVTTFKINMLGDETVVTADEENIHAVLVSQFSDFELGPYRCEGFRPLLGEGIFATDGPKWAHSRAMLKPQFTRTQMSDLALEERHIDRLMAALPADKDGDGWTSHADFRTLFHHYTLDSAMEMLLGVTSETKGFDTGMSGEMDWERLTHCVDLSLSMIATRLLLGPLYWVYDTREFRECRGEVFGFVDRCVTSALEAQAQEKEKDEKEVGGAEEEEKSRYILLHALAKETQDPIELREQMLNVLLAGRDTTAAFLSYLVILLARHPRVYAKLRAEVLAKFGSSISSTKTEISFYSLRSCTYLQHTLSETARLYPLVPATKRQASVNTTLPRGGGPDGRSPIYLRKGQDVVYDTHTLHRSKRIWGDNAEEFYPERWEGWKVGREYIPFSAGPRICVGQQLALTKAAYFAVRLVQRFDRMEDLNAENRIRCKVALGNSPADAVALRLREARD